MALNCDDMMLPSIPQGKHGNCNPQEDSIGKNKVAIQPAPWPKDTDLPPWSQLEKMKKEANKVAFQSFPRDEHTAVITVIQDDTKPGESQTFSVDWEEPPNSIQVSLEDNSLIDNQGFPKASGDGNKNNRSECTPFAKDAGGYVHSENAAVGSMPPVKNIPNEQQEPTEENFNEFLEMSSMTTNSIDHAVTIGKEDQEKKMPTKSHWSDSILKSQELADAPSGILLVFDRLLDCIDPKERRFSRPSEDGEHEDDTQTDQSSAWSLSMNQSWLESLEEFSINTSDEASLFRFSMEDGPDWLDESLDCIFPCWKQPEVAVTEAKDLKPLRKASTMELVEALEAGRKRKWTAKEPENDEEHLPEMEESDTEKSKTNEEDNVDAQAVVLPVCSSEEDDPFDFPSPEFPPPVWKKPAPIEIDPTDTLESNASESTLSELFQGLVYGTPSDEKEGRIDDLNNYLDRTSVTGTLSYSDGTI